MIGGKTAALGMLAILILSATAAAQSPILAGTSTDGVLHAVGWEGFNDTRFIIESLGALVLATVLALAIAFHPMTHRTVDTAEEAEMPKVYVMYAVIGAVIGVTVLEYGMVVGLVIFGIGGLFRFRTNTESTRDTGRLIVVTLIGLISGLGLPHFAVITTAFIFALIYFFDAKPACTVEIKKIPGGQVAAAAAVYREVLTKAGCRVLSEKKSFGKERLEYVFRMPSQTTRDKLHELLCAVPANVRGDVEWEVS